MAHSGATDHRMLIQVNTASLINQICGGAVIAPWEIDWLPEDWLSVFKGLDRLPEMKRLMTDVERALEKKRKEHPNYGGR